MPVGRSGLRSAQRDPDTMARMKTGPYLLQVHVHVCAEHPGLDARLQSEARWEQGDRVALPCDLSAVPSLYQGEVCLEPIPSGMGDVLRGARKQAHGPHPCGSSRGDLLDLFGQGRDPVAVALIGRREGQRQQMAQRVDRDMDLRSLAPLGSVIAGTRSALGCGLQRAAVNADRPESCATHSCCAPHIVLRPTRPVARAPAGQHPRGTATNTAARTTTPPPSHPTDTPSEPCPLPLAHPSMLKRKHTPAKNLAGAKSIRPSSVCRSFDILYNGVFASGRSCVPSQTDLLFSTQTAARERLEGENYVGAE